MADLQCASVHFRHLRKTGGTSVRDFFIKGLGYEKMPPPARREEFASYSAELQQLTSSRDYFDAHQLGRRTFPAVS